MDVRESIVQAGAMLLKEHGVAALTQPKVARAAGVKQSHLTYYFPRRGDLLLGIAESTIEKVINDLSARLDTEPAQAAVLETVVNAMLTGIPPRIMLGLIVAADSEPALREPLRRLIAQVRQRISDVLRKAGAPASANTTLLFHATIVGLAILHDAQRTPESAAEIKDGVVTMMQLLGMAPDDAKKEVRP